MSGIREDQQKVALWIDYSSQDWIGWLGRLETVCFHAGDTLQAVASLHSRSP